MDCISPWGRKESDTTEWFSLSFMKPNVSCQWHRYQVVHYLMIGFFYTVFVLLLINFFFIDLTGFIYFQIETLLSFSKNQDIVVSIKHNVCFPTVFSWKGCFQFSRSVVSDSLQSHGLQQVRPPRPLPTLGVYSNSYPLSRWCHPTISSSVIPFASRLQSFPASGSFQMSQFFISGGQSTSPSAAVLPMNIQDWFPLGWTGWTLCCPRDSQESSPPPQFKSINSAVLSFFYSPTLTPICDYWKNHSFD